MIPKEHSCDLVLTRVYDAPVSSVWEAWADPNQVALWWGPRGFSITTKSKELRVGGKWIYTMHGPDGVDYPNMTTYFSVDPLKSLEYDHGANENQKALFRVKVHFAEKDSRTEMHMTMTFESPQIAKDMSGFIKSAYGNSTWDRLGEYLEEKINKKYIFILNRSFEATIATAFDMFVNTAKIEKWQPPTGFSMTVISGQVKTGDSIFYQMNNEDVKFFGRSSYQQIVEPHLLAFTQEFCDESGQNSKHPGAPTWPKKWLTSVTLTSEGPTSTRVTLKSELFGDATPAEIEAFVSERRGMMIGWSGSFDRLETLLKNI